MTDERWSAHTRLVEFTIVEAPMPARRTRKTGPSRPRWTPETTFLCPNCERRWHPDSLRPWYCSLRCQSEAKAVRYGRQKIIEYPEGWPDDIKQHVGMKIAHALAGGYDQGARRLPPEVRAAVIERDLGRCVLCHELGEDIDHIDGPSSDLSNVRFLCKPCHNRVTRAHFKPITDEETKRQRDSLLARILRNEPLRPSDDPGWDAVRAKWRRAHIQTGVAVTPVH